MARVIFPLLAALVLTACATSPAARSATPSPAPASTLLAVTALIVPTAVPSATAAATAPSGAEPTRVVHYVPDPPQGEGRPGSCWTSSIAAARPDAWRCSAENAIFDPCFTTSDPQLVSCEPDPIHEDPGVLLMLTEPLPTPETTSTSTSPWAWMVELADGSLCTPFTGTRSMIAGKMTTYGCQDANQQPGVTILDDLIPGTVWQAEIADHEQVRTVTVKTVWQ